MALYIASDHGGFSLKQGLIEYLQNKGALIIDLGPSNAETAVDYPDYAQALALKVLEVPEQRGILICGTGIGMSIAANRIPKIRAALCHDVYTAEMSRKHNDSNVLVLGGRVLSLEQGIAITQMWLDTGFEGGRHQKRLEKL